MISCVVERQPWLAADAAGRVIFQELRKLETDDPGMELVAVVTMPDHLHAVIRLGPTLSVSELMRRFRGRSARAINAIHERAGPLWQPGYFEHALRPDESLQTVFHYMWHNPDPPGLRFRCRAEVWHWFKSRVTGDESYFRWLSENPAYRAHPGRSGFSRETELHRG